MAAAAVALADLRQIHHLRGIGFGPGVGAYGDLGAEARLREADGVGRLRMEIVGNELVVALEGLVDDVEVDGALL